MPENRTKTGQFKKGSSGNPGGRPKKPDWFKKDIETLSPKALKALGDIVGSEKSKPSDIIQASKIILEYGIGKPTQVIDVDANVTESVKTIEFKGVLDDWSK